MRNGLIISLILVGLDGQAFPRDWFVSNVCGSDAGTGNRDRPFASIKAALVSASKWDTIRVLPSADSAGECPPLMAYPNTSIPMGSTDLCIVAEAGPQETRIEGFSVASDVTCTIRGFTIMNPLGDGIFIDDNPRQTDRVVVENCVIHECAKNGIQVDNTGANASNSRVWIRNCVIYGCARAGVLLNAVDSFGALQPGATIENSIITKNNEEGIKLSVCPPRSDWPDIVIRYCYVLGNNNNGQQVSCPGSSKIVVINPLVNTPVFLKDKAGPDGAPCDFRLDPQSALIDKGNPDCIFQDPDGTLNDPGAFGGPGALVFYPQGGPIILRIEIEATADPTKVKVRVLARER